MGVPKIFVSSTCYDIEADRDRIYPLISSYGFEPIQSDENDILYDPRENTLPSCIKAVEKSDLMIHILTGRFGTPANNEAIKHVNLNNIIRDSYDKTFFKLNKISITQLEVLKALEEKIPVFVFISKELISDRRIYNDIKRGKESKHQLYESLEKQEDAESIFEFLNFIIRREYNNGYFIYETNSDSEKKKLLSKAEEVINKQILSYYQKLLNENRNKQKDLPMKYDDFTHVCIPDSTGYALLMLKVAKYLNKECILEKNSDKFSIGDSISEIARDNYISLRNDTKRMSDYILTKDEILRFDFPWKDFWLYDDLKYTNSYSELVKSNSVIIVPEKLTTDGNSRADIKEQSLGWGIFSLVLKKIKDKTIILGQHFDKEKDKERIVDICKDKGIIIPDIKEKPEAFGMRGVPLNYWSEMYKNADIIIGIAGTHTWQILTMFPETPQIILYNDIMSSRYEDFDFITKSLSNVRAIKFPPVSQLSDHEDEMLANTIFAAYEELLKNNKK